MSTSEVEVEGIDLGSAGLSKRGAWLWSLGWAPESYCAR